MQRRTFIKQTAAAAGALAAASATAPLILGAEDKSATKRPVIGTGEYRYECWHDWGQLPSHIKWETTHGVAIDEAGFIYIKHQGHSKKWADAMDAIVVFDPQGKFVRSFGKEYYPGGHGIDIRKENGEEFLYLCDIDHCTVSKTNLKGELVWKFGYLKIPHVYKQFGKFQTDQRRLSSGWRVLCRRRLRLALYPSIRQRRPLDSHLRRRGDGAGQIQDAARPVGR